MPIRVTLLYSPGPRRVIERPLILETPCSVSEAVGISGILDTCPELGADLASGILALGIWGEKVSGNRMLADLDRVEIYRPLEVDPKLARRKRFAGQGVRATGLFAKRRPGAKPGY